MAESKQEFLARRRKLIASYIEDSGMSRKEAGAMADFDLGARSWVVVPKASVTQQDGK